MKNKTIALTIVSVAIALSGLQPVRADERPALASLNTSNLVSKDFKKLGSDLFSAWKTMKPFTTNGEATFRLGYGLNTASKSQVEAAMLTVPINDSIAVGIVGAHIGSDWMEGGANLSAGAPFNWYVFGKVRAVIGDGVVWNFQKSEAANYAFTAVEKDFHIKKADIGIGIVAANTSDRKGVDIIGGLKATWRFGKR